VRSPTDVPLAPSLAGAFAGALHGCGWIPQRWWDALGETEAGAALRAAALDAGLALGPRRR
jgi:ADP-ribosylglycohydrolase